MMHDRLMGASLQHALILIHAHAYARLSRAGRILPVRGGKTHSQTYVLGDWEVGSGNHAHVYYYVIIVGHNF